MDENDVIEALREMLQESAPDNDLADCTIALGVSNGASFVITNPAGDAFVILAVQIAEAS